MRVMSAKNTRLDRILSATATQSPGCILLVFEAINGRKPTAEEIAALARGRRAANVKRGRTGRSA